MANKKRKPEAGNQRATTNYYKIVPCQDYVYLMIEIKAISMAMEGGF